MVTPWPMAIDGRWPTLRPIKLENLKTLEVSEDVEAVDSAAVDSFYDKHPIMSRAM